MVIIILIMGVKLDKETKEYLKGSEGWWKDGSVVSGLELTWWNFRIIVFGRLKRDKMDDSGGRMGYMNLKVQRSCCFLVITKSRLCDFRIECLRLGKGQDV